MDLVLNIPCLLYVTSNSRSSLFTVCAANNMEHFVSVLSKDDSRPFPLPEKSILNIAKKHSSFV